MPNSVVAELVEVISVANEKGKIATMDLMRLVVLNEMQAGCVLAKHWDLISTHVIAYLASHNIKDKNNRMLHNFHLVSLKMMANFF